MIIILHLTAQITSYMQYRIIENILSMESNAKHPLLTYPSLFSTSIYYGNEKSQSSKL